MKVCEVGQVFSCDDCKKPTIKNRKWQSLCDSCRIENRKENSRMTAKRWYWNNRQRSINYVGQWRKDHPERAKKIQVDYRRRKGHITREEYLATQWKKENNPNWRGGTTEDYFYQTEEWKKLALETWTRDKFICQRCKTRVAKGVKPCAHHIIPRRLGGEDILSNLITLCQSCHTRTEWETWKFGQVYL